MTEVDRISLAPSASSSALIRDGLLMKSKRRNVDQERRNELNQRGEKLCAAAAAGAPAESKQLPMFDLQPIPQLFSFN